VLVQQCGADLVRARELVRESGALAVRGVLHSLAAWAGVDDGGGAVHAERLRPEGAEVDVEAVLLTEVGDGLLFQEGETEQSDLRLGGERTTLASPGLCSARVGPLTPAKANSRSS
jgi:hypothetical protein